MKCIQFTGHNNQDCLSFLGSNYDNTRNCPNVITAQGVVDLHIGELIVQDDNGEFYAATLRLPEKEVQPWVHLEATCVKAFENPGKLFPIEDEAIPRILEGVVCSQLKVVRINEKPYLVCAEKE